MTFPSYRDLIYLTWKQYLVRFDVILGANLAIALPVHLLTILATPAQLGATDQTDIMVWLDSILADQNLWFVIALNILGNLILLLVDLIIITLLRSMYHQQKVSWQYLFKQAIQYYPRAVMVSIAVALCTLLGFSLFIIPGIVIGTLLSLVLPILIWENASVWQAIRRSAQLVRRHWWSVFWVLLVTELWLSVTAWLLLSILPVAWFFTVFGITVVSIMTSFQTILTVIIYTACATQKKTTEPTAQATDTSTQ